MKISVETTLEYDLEVPGPAVLSVETAGAFGQTILDAHIDLGDLESFARVPGDEGIGERIVIRPREHLSCKYRATVLIERPRPDFSSLQATPFEQLPGDALRYTLPSRYCPSERFGNFVHKCFGNLSGGARVAAMRDWVEENLDYTSGVSGPETTAVDTFLERRGVCRDYAHLLISLCRAANIPARMASVYAPDVDPPDFHAVAEIFLDGAWHLIDATGMAYADNMAIIAVGRDATDVAFLSSVQMATLVSQSISVRRAD
ncbi:transglutaminase-like domain-containing protein [Paracoccus aerodenitrificans]|uniref:transglutaminase-like domain-containing protein n=1 Tax=Paracoccus aerodenitrificans TaxID=3017781 RepID=UPI0022F098F3|nr:transglutaminase family protein [Paracoccus aerodenitrificans]WBU65370.1 transglutaminase family protein [Paracoccus aerodenitrificans]